MSTSDPGMPPPALIAQLKRQGFREFLLVCPDCGKSGIGMVQPGYEEDGPKCVDCEVPFTLIIAPEGL